MTITFLGEIPEGRTAVNAKGKRSYKRVFRLSTDSKTDTAFDIGSHGSLPVIGSTFPDDANAYCKTLSVACDAGYKGWTVTAEYDDEYDTSGTATSDEIQINWSTELFQREAWVDKDGNGVVNSAGDPFNPPVMRDDARIVCSVTQNVASPPAYIITMPNVVNSTSFTIDGLSVGARYAKISSVSVSGEQRRNGTIYRAVTVEMHIRNQTWDFVILDAGYRIINPDDSTKRIKVTNDDGTDPTEPILLNGSGAVLANPTAATAVFGTYRVYTEANYIGTIPGCS